MSIKKTISIPAGERYVLALLDVVTHAPDPQKPGKADMKAVLTQLKMKLQEAVKN